MLTPEQVQKYLQFMSVRAVAKAAGVHPNTVHKIAKGEQNVSLESFRKVSDVLEELSKSDD